MIHQPPGQAVATTDTPRTRARRGDDRDGALAAPVLSDTQSQRALSLKRTLTACKKCTMCSVLSDLGLL